MKTLILIFTLAAFNMSFAMNENMADCGLGTNFSEVAKNQAPIEVSADSEVEIQIESSEI